MFLDFLYKKKCISCNRIQNNLLCKPCESLIQTLEYKCSKCQFILNSNVCNHCNNNEIYFEKLFCIGVYSGLLKTLIYEYKYNKNKDLSIIFSNLIEKNINIKDKVDIITSIPIHKEKMKSRGFNQSELLAKEIAYKKRWKYLNILDRIKNTKAQFSLNLDERKENLKNAFIINSKINLKNKNIVIVDDIYTTGTTIKEACKLLKNNCVNKIFVIVIARAIE
ncbi:MAG: hypothetical protein KatS3mg068_0768 [Candidatus Sericytochromatia bacterium]|nr:MAG: hypothetical protein KatS3mg068_0768 [Candidatus Sericytochromatia bacterium]